MSGASWDSNAAYDVIPVFSPDDHMNPIANYLGSGMEKYLMHPYASPIFGDFKDLPPLLIQSGDSEVLQDEITMLANKAELAGVKVRHEEYEDGVSLHRSTPTYSHLICTLGPCLPDVPLSQDMACSVYVHAHICAGHASTAPARNNTGVPGDGRTLHGDGNG